jgi:MATE family multidrug resistance protein
MTMTNTKSAVSAVLSKQHFKQLCALTAPILITQLAQIGMATIDTIMSGHVGTADLAAIAIGSSLWTPILLFVAGVMVGFTPQVAKLVGANQTDKVGEILGSAITVGIGLGCLMGLLLYFFGPMLSYLLPDPYSALLMREYVQAVAWGLPAAGGFLALRFHAEALNQPGSVTKIMLFGLLLNIPANGLFVYGWLGIEPMGGSGCGYGTSLIFHFLFIALLINCYKHRLPPHQRTLATFFTMRRDPMVSLIALGLPIGSAIFFEVGFFSVIALFLTPLGTEVVAGHQVAINLSSLTFMVPLSVGMAITVMVSQQLGREKTDGAASISWLGVRINFTLAIMNASLIILFAPHIAQLYSGDPVVVEIGASLLIFAAIFQFSDAIQIAAAGALRGYQDTIIVMVITFFSYWICGLGLGYFLAFEGFDGLEFLGFDGFGPLGAKGFWIGIIVGLTAAAIMLTYRLRKMSQAAINSKNIHA